MPSGYTKPQEFLEDLSYYKDAHDRLIPIFQKYWNALEELRAFALAIEDNIVNAKVLDNRSKAVAQKLLQDTIRIIYAIRRGEITKTPELQNAMDNILDAYNLFKNNLNSPATESMRRYRYRRY